MVGCCGNSSINTRFSFACKIKSQCQAEIEWKKRVLLLMLRKQFPPSKWEWFDSCEYLLFEVAILSLIL